MAASGVRHAWRPVSAKAAKPMRCARSFLRFVRLGSRGRGRGWRLGRHHAWRQDRSDCAGQGTRGRNRRMTWQRLHDGSHRGGCREQRWRDRFRFGYRGGDRIGGRRRRCRRQSWRCRCRGRRVWRRCMRRDRRRRYRRGLHGRRDFHRRRGRPRQVVAGRSSSDRLRSGYSGGYGRSGLVFGNSKQRCGGRRLLVFHRRGRSRCGHGRGRSRIPGDCCSIQWTWRFAARSRRPCRRGCAVGIFVIDVVRRGGRGIILGGRVRVFATTAATATAAALAGAVGIGGVRRCGCLGTVSGVVDEFGGFGLGARCGGRFRGRRTLRVVMRRGGRIAACGLGCFLSAGIGGGLGRCGRRGFLRRARLTLRIVAARLA